MKKLIIIFGICFLQFTAFSQGKELISAEDEIYLPLDPQTHQVYYTASFNEATYDIMGMKKIILENKLKYYDSTKFFFLEETDTTIEYFVVYPCTLIDDASFYSHKLVREGIVVSSFSVIFREKKYELVLKDFYWVNKNKLQVKIGDLYKKYKNENSIREKVKLYGILKSAENSIAETLSNFTIVLEDIIESKISKSNN